MATVYTAIAAFENMVRQFVVKILMENKGENWWTECVSDKIRKSADSRKAEEDKIKWHTHRGTSMINYVDFADLANIMGQNYDLFEVHIVSLEWAKQIFTTLEKSRNHFFGLSVRALVSKSSFFIRISICFCTV